MTDARNHGKVRPSKGTRSHATPASPPTDDRLVILDNPDDGELFDTGDAADFAGDTHHRALRRSGQGSAQGRPQPER